MADTVIFNPTSNPIIAQFDGGYYTFKPGDKKSIFNSFAAKHILNRWGKYGLVDITFDEKAAQKFKIPAVYEHEKSREGLEKYLATLYEKNNNYQVYLDECGDRKSAERYRTQREGEKVVSEIEVVETQLQNLGKVDTQGILKDHAQSLLDQAELLKKQAGELSGNNTRQSKNSDKDRAKG